MSILSIILICVLALIILFLIICTINAVIAFYTPFRGQNDIYGAHGVPHIANLARKVRDQVKKVALINYESCRTESFDGLMLHAKYYHKDDDAPIILLMHGYRGVPERDFCFVLPMLLENGYNVLMPDERGTGKSQGHAVTFGIKERKDVRTWIYYIIKRFGNDKKICLYGISMGAASVLMATELKLPDQVKCIVADCPYTAPKEIIQKTCKRFKLPKAISYALLKIGAFIYIRIDIDSSSPIEAVKHNDIPIQLIHGEEDWFVPCYMSEEIRKNCFGYAERYTFKGADHAFSSVVDLERYQLLVMDFLKRFLN